MSSYYSYPSYGAPLPPTSHPYPQPSTSIYPPQPSYGYPGDPYATQHHLTHVPQMDLSDPNQLRDFYRNELAYLTVNSKPVINRLTLIADEHGRTRANVIVQCIEDALNRVPSYMRLPLLYLIDSICKNVGHPYPSLFSRFIERSFLQTYHLMQTEQPQLCQKLEELLGTWRTGGTNGGELFRAGVQKGIESALWGRTGRGGGWAEGSRGDSQAFHNGVMGVTGNATVDERTAVLADVRRLLDLRVSQTGLLHDEIEIETNERQISALQQLENLIQSTQLTSDQVNDIRSQLSALAPPPPPPPQMPNSLNLLNQSLMNSLVGIDMSALLQAVAQPQPQQPVPSSIDLSAFGGLLPGVSTTAPVAAGSQDLLSQLLGGKDKVADLENILKGLNQKGDEEKEQREWERDVVALNVTLSNADIQKTRTDAWKLLYGRLSLQCKQCGRRYLEGSKGRREFDDHLDYHYRLNKHLREGISRAQNRSVLLGEELWLVGDLADIDEEKERAEAEEKERKAEDERRRKMYVVAPTDPKREARPCSVCMEGFKKEFREESGEWVWFNAVHTPEGRIDHATCDFEVKESTKRRKLEEEQVDITTDVKEESEEETLQIKQEEENLRKRKASEESDTEQCSESDKKRVKTES